MDLDAILNEAAAEQFKPEPPKKRIDPPEIKPWLAATANVNVEFRDKWNTLVRRDVDVVVPSKFQTSNAYRVGDSTPSPGAQKLLYEVSLFSDIKRPMYIMHQIDFCCCYSISWLKVRQQDVDWRNQKYLSY